MHVDLFILLITCFINLLLGLIVLFRDAKRLYAGSFATMNLFICVWIIANFITNHYIDDLAITNIANKFTYVAGFASVVAGLVFSYNFPYSRKVSRTEVGAVGAITTITILLSLFTNVISGEVILDQQNQLSYPTGDFLWFFIVCFFVILALMARNLLSVPKVQGEKKRQQARYIFLALVISAFMALSFNVIIPVFTASWEASRFGPLTMILLVGTIAYTIIKHGLFDIRVAVVRGVAYFLSLLTLAGLYYVLAYAISEIIFHNNSVVLVSQNPVSILLALVLAFTFQPVKNFFDRLTSRIFFRNEYNTDDFFAELSRELSAATDLKTVLQRAARKIGNTLKAEYAYFFVRYGEGKHITAGMEYHLRFNADEIDELEHLLPVRPTIVVTDILEEKDPLYAFLTKNKIAIVLPLIQADILLGYLFLGYQKGRSYVKRDVRALETISDELVIAIQNAFSIQEVKEINETLQQRIREATKELRKTNSQLQRLDEAKDEFISMASHQLRTPLTSVKGYISMVLEGDAGKVAETQRQLLEEAFASSERMVHLINDFLNVSRLQTGKFMLEDRMSDLPKIVLQEVDSLKQTVRAHALTLKYKKPSYFPMLRLDEAKIRQVIMNFIDNAIYYSHEGSTITVELAVEEGQAVLRVKDTGIGVPEPEQQHLFSKFFRATNARKQRPDGTGVGLFLAKKVIDAHGGTILFESAEGKGSTFGFRLPIKKLSSKDADGAKKLDK
jgi:signal transduction histidine kinase